MFRRASLAFVLALSAAWPAAAQDATHPWDATWVGDWDSANDNGVQVIVTGDQVIGFFLNGDYLLPSATSPIAADGSLAFKWDKGHGTLKVDGDKRELVVDADGAPERVIVLNTE